MLICRFLIDGKVYGPVELDEVPWPGMTVTFHLGGALETREVESFSVTQSSDGDDFLGFAVFAAGAITDPNAAVRELARIMGTADDDSRGDN